MSELPQKQGTIACPRCKAPMEEVIRIAPALHEPGLVAYECPSCRYVTSVLTPAGGETGSGRRTPALAVKREAEEDWGKQRWR